MLVEILILEFMLIDLGNTKLYALDLFWYQYIYLVMVSVD